MSSVTTNLGDDEVGGGGCGDRIRSFSVQLRVILMEVVSLCKLRMRVFCSQGFVESKENNSFALNRALGPRVFRERDP